MRQELQWKVVDNWKRQYFLKYELKIKLLKSVKNNTNIPLIYSQYMTYKLMTMPYMSPSTRHVNRCIQTGRTWSLMHKFQLSSFVMRDKGYCGHLPGFSRISW